MAVVEFPIVDGGCVLVEVPDSEFARDDDGLIRAGAGDRVVRAAEGVWERGLAGVQKAAESVLGAFLEMSPHPEEVKVCFGVSMKADINACVVGSSVDAHFKVEVLWRPADQSKTS